MEHLITGVIPGSPAYRNGIREGDTLLSLNGEELIDQIDYQALAGRRHVVLHVRKADGRDWHVEIIKPTGRPLGLSFGESMELTPRVCKNKCVFCFIDQMPPNCRKTLYVKDDDWRMSLMMGNFITMTNMKEEDFQKIIDYRMSPINVSIHTTDPKLRVMMLKNKNAVEPEVFNVNWDVDSAEKGGYDFFMLKEIFEQPKIINDFLSMNLSGDDFLKKINLDNGRVKNFNRIYIVGCGTAYHAGLIGARLLEKLPDVFISVQMASEFRYSNQIIDEKTLMIVISQSGETADTLAALRMAKKNGASILAIVNVVGSSIDRESDNVIYIAAGPEISVASTKAFSAQLMAFYLLFLNLYRDLKIMSDGEFDKAKENLYELPALVNQILARESDVKNVVQKYLSCKNVFYIGRGLDYFIALEGSLKLKEIAYLYSQAYAAGELKHGPIALIDDTILVIGLATQQNVLEKTLSNLKECKARSGKIITIANEMNEGIENISDDVFIIPKTDEIFEPLLANIVLQLFAYYVASGLGYDIDKPRNLAKSVTVE